MPRHRPQDALYYADVDIDSIDIIDLTPSIEEVMIAWEVFHIYIAAISSQVESVVLCS